MQKECGKARRKKISEENKKAPYARPAVEMEKEINVVIGGCGDLTHLSKSGDCDPGTKNINS